MAELGGGQVGAQPSTCGGIRRHALLLAAVVGSGIMGERLANGNVAVALLANTVATGAALVALILTFGPISAPTSTPRCRRRCITGWPALVAGGRIFRRANRRRARRRGARGRHVWGARVRVVAARTKRIPQFLSEAVATFGLLSVIWGCARRRPDAVPFAVGAYITAAYWFTASTSFANPAVTLARALTNTFAGIRPSTCQGFLVGQTVGAAAATVLFRWLVPALPAVADRVVVPHDRERSESRSRG